MKKILAAVALTLLVAATAAADLRGAWTAESESSGKLQMNLTYRANQHGETMLVSDFSGLTQPVVDAAVQPPVNFQLRREAGSIAFEGTFKNGIGAGQFTFTPSSDYAATLRSLGVTFRKDGDDPVDRNLLTMTLLDVSTAYIRSMQAEGFRETAEKYVEMRIFKVTPEYVRAMRAAGYPDLTAQQLVESRIHGATPEFISQMKAIGYDNVPFRQLVEFRIFKVTPEFVRELKDAGYEHVPARKLVEMRIQGIDAGYIKRMNATKK
ncbi:MAG TPA: hypothetical protein VLU46_16855 [Thermoanaerobaculia bacterium]|nr:hypothetical protein [Thermoanaerobaculia bacterium]